MSDSIVRVPACIYMGMEVSLHVQHVDYARPPECFLKLIAIPFPCVSERNFELTVCFSGAPALSSLAPS